MKNKINTEHKISKINSKKTFLIKLIGFLILFLGLNNICALENGENYWASFIPPEQLQQPYGPIHLITSPYNQNDTQIDDYRYYYDNSPNIYLVLAGLSLCQLAFSIYKKNLFNNREIGPKQRAIIFDVTAVFTFFYITYKFKTINKDSLDSQSLKEILFQNSELRHLIERITFSGINILSLSNLIYKSLKNKDSNLIQKKRIPKELINRKTECGICRENLKKLRKKLKNLKIKLINICNEQKHIFCIECIKSWVNEKGESEINCPLCREKFNEENENLKIEFKKDFNFKDIVLKNPCYNFMIVILTLIIINELRDLVVNF